MYRYLVSLGLFQLFIKSEFPAQIIDPKTIDEKLIDLIKSPVSEVTKKYVNLPADFLRHKMMFIFQSSKLFFSFFVSVIEKRQEISSFLTYHSYKNE